MNTSLAAQDFKIVSLSYDVHNRKMFGILQVARGADSASVNFSFPYSAKPHASDEELRRDMESEARIMLKLASDFQ